MNKGKVIAGLLISAGTAMAAYYGIFYKFEDGMTAWQKLKGKVGMGGEEAAEAGTAGTTAAPVVYRKGEVLFAAKDAGLYSKPEESGKYLKALAKKYDQIGSNDSANADYPGWSKVWVTKTFKDSQGKDVANKWFAYVKTSTLTNKKV